MSGQSCNIHPTVLICLYLWRKNSGSGGSPMTMRWKSQLIYGLESNRETSTFMRSFKNGIQRLIKKETMLRTRPLCSFWCVLCDSSIKYVVIEKEQTLLFDRHSYQRQSQLSIYLNLWEFSKTQTDKRCPMKNKITKENAD